MMEVSALWEHSDMDEQTDQQKEFSKRAYEYCSWMSQKSFTYPNWDDDREEFLKVHWNSFIDYAINALGNPLSINQKDLHQVITTYQGPSYLNSLAKIFTKLISHELAHDEKIIWTGLIEDEGVREIRSMGIEGRPSSTHYLILTNKSLIIKVGNKSLTQKIPIGNLELEPFGDGFQITQEIFHPDHDYVKIPIFISQGNVNGQEVKMGSHMRNSHIIHSIYSDNFLKLIAAFAIARNYQEIKLELIEDGLIGEELEQEKDEALLAMVWSNLVETWGNGPRMIDHDLEILIRISKNRNLDSDCIDEIIKNQVKYAVESKRGDSEVRNWLSALQKRSNINTEQRQILEAAFSALKDRNRAT
jgi:hypothetical protein